MNEIQLSLTAHNLGKRLIIDGRPFIGGICLHDTAGSGSHNDTIYLSHPGDGRKVSVDFTVERDGSIWQLNPDLNKFCTFHAGRATKWIAGGRVFRNRAVTQVLIGIEIVQQAAMKLNPIWPDQQVKSVAELCYFLCSKFNLTKEQVTTHAKVITDGSRSDPRQFPFDAFWFHFNRVANMPAIDPPPGPLGQPVIVEVAANDTLWAIAKRYNSTVEQIKHLNGMNTPSNVIRPGQKLIIKK
jgi:hypothetical protein